MDSSGTGETTPQGTRADSGIRSRRDRDHGHGRTASSRQQATQRVQGRALLVGARGDLGTSARPSVVGPPALAGHDPTDLASDPQPAVRCGLDG
jgi:hypothetical protein